MSWIAAPPAPTIESHRDGDGTHIDLRLLVAPSAGRFHLAETDGEVIAGETISDGTVIGHVIHAGSRQAVTSFCGGILIDVLAESHDQVRAGQPLAVVRPVSR